jgi:hypothetical protein
VLADHSVRDTQAYVTRDGEAKRPARSRTIGLAANMKNLATGSQFHYGEASSDE